MRRAVAHQGNHGLRIALSWTSFRSSTTDWAPIAESLLSYAPGVANPIVVSDGAVYAAPSIVTMLLGTSVRKWSFVTGLVSLKPGYNAFHADGRRADSCPPT